MADFDGTNGNDTLNGTNAGESFQGYGGNDIIYAQGGNDDVRGDEAGYSGQTDDSLFAGPGDDEVSAGNGDDYAWGEDGNDRIWGDWADDVEDGDDYLSGGDGDDMLFGKGGADELAPGLGSDLVAGGDGNDVASYIAIETTGIEVTLADSGSTSVTKGFETDTLTDIENVTGTARADTITGNQFGNRIEGYGGDDTLDGGTGPGGLVLFPELYHDTAVYKGAREHYTVWVEGGALKITDNRTPAQRQADSVHYDADEGTDTLRNFEYYEFKDDTYTLSQLLASEDDYADTVGDTGKPYGILFLYGDAMAGTLNGDATGDIESAGDTDVFEVYLEAGQQYIIDLKGADTGDGTLADPHVRIHDASGVQIESDDSRVADLHSLVSIVPTETGYYYIQAAADDGTGTGDYHVYVEGGGTQHDDVLTGDEEPDIYLGLGGNDTLSGGAGDDLVKGDDGNDDLSGDDGNDSMAGGTGQDTMRGGSGEDYIFGGTGNDTIFGGSGDDEVVGARGNDTVGGGKGNDLVRGNNGRDVLAGHGGDDEIVGGAGQDILAAGRGNDTVTGGSQADIFVFRANDDDNTITDFQNNFDKIEIQAGATGFNQLSVADAGPDVEISWNNTVVRLENVATASIGSEDFLFV